MLWQPQDDELSSAEESQSSGPTPIPEAFSQDLDAEVQENPLVDNLLIAVGNGGPKVPLQKSGFSKFFMDYRPEAAMMSNAVLQATSGLMEVARQWNETLVDGSKRWNEGAKLLSRESERWCNTMAEESRRWNDFAREASVQWKDVANSHFEESRRWNDFAREARSEWNVTVRELMAESKRWNETARQVSSEWNNTAREWNATAREWNATAREWNATVRELTAESKRWNKTAREVSSEWNATVNDSSVRWNATAQQLNNVLLVASVGAIGLGFARLFFRRAPRVHRRRSVRRSTTRRY